MPIPNSDNEKQQLTKQRMDDILRGVSFTQIADTLFDDTAARCAVKVALKEGDIRPKRENAISQIRKFYNEFTMWNEKITDDASFKANIPFVKMMNAKIAYARGRHLIDDDFASFLNKLISNVTNPVSMKNAKLFFEAFMGFYKQVHPK